MSKDKIYETEDQHHLYNNTQKVSLKPCRIVVDSKYEGTHTNPTQYSPANYTNESKNSMNSYPLLNESCVSNDLSSTTCDQLEKIRIDSSYNKNSNNSTTMPLLAQVTPATNMFNYHAAANAVPLQECPLRMSKSDTVIMKTILRKCRKRDKRYRKSEACLAYKGIQNKKEKPPKIDKFNARNRSTKHMPLRCRSNSPIIQNIYEYPVIDSLSTNNSNRCQYKIPDEHCKKEQDPECCYYESPLHRDLRAQSICIISQCRHLRKRPSKNKDSDSGTNDTTSDDEIKEESINRCQIDDVTSDIRIGYLFRFGCKKIKKSRKDFAKEAAEKLSQCQTRIQKCEQSTKINCPEVTYQKTPSANNYCSGTELPSQNNCPSDDNGVKHTQINIFRVCNNT